MSDSTPNDIRFSTVKYKHADGRKIEAPLADVPATSLADGLPWRRFHWYFGQKNFCGTYWCATERKHVDYESRLELACLVMRDFDPQVRRIAGQPFHLTADVRGEALTRIPDYLMITDTEAVVVDVKNSMRLRDPAVRRILALTAEVIGATGWRHEVVSEPPAVRYANIQFLAGYRRNWLFPSEIVDRVRECGSAMLGSSIMEVIGATDIPEQQAFPALMHLLWRGSCTTDLNVPLSRSARLEWRP